MKLKEGGQELINQWLENKHDALKSLDIESNIIDFIRTNIENELELYTEEELLNASKEVKDMFDIYEDIKDNAPTLLEEKIDITDKVNKLQIRKKKWGLLEDEVKELDGLLEKLNVIDIQLTIYNHVVNFSIPNTLKLYIESKSDFKLVFLLEMYEFLQEDSNREIIGR